MHPQTGEIRIFETEIPEDWIGLDHLKEGKELTLHGLKFEIVKSKITPGKPGKVELSLKGMPTDPFKEAFGDSPTTTFGDAMKAYKERTGKKEWE